MPNEGGEGKQNRHFEGELMKNIPPPPPLAPVNRRMKQNRHGWGFPIVFYVSSHFQVSQHALMTQAPGSEHKRLENIIFLGFNTKCSESYIALIPDI